MQLLLDLEPDATAELIRQSVAAWRPLDMQAEVLLRTSLGLPPSPAVDQGECRAHESGGDETE